MKTDILCWVDGDIENFGPHFIYGVVGPLLTRKDLGFIKGFYRRPIRVNGSLYPTGGGRVTELLLRPVLNMFYPDLSRILQPLSGEYAVRREIIEQIPICTNYGAETCMLLDIYKKWGLKVIGQADLIERIHRNQSLEQLAKLSFGLLQAIFNRLDIHRKVKLLREPKWREGRYDFESIQINEVQRPPIATVAEYQKAFVNRQSKWPAR
jgi:glucosyl-3-phosphoglycerate synthase